MHTPQNTSYNKWTKINKKKKITSRITWSHWNYWIYDLLVSIPSTRSQPNKSFSNHYWMLHSHIHLWNWSLLLHIWIFTIQEYTFEAKEGNRRNDWGKSSQTIVDVSWWTRRIREKQSHKRSSQICFLLLHQSGHNIFKKTILVTAASGVAATLINGDTLHKSCFLNNKELNDKVDEFKQVRMIIVDEVSLLSQQTINYLTIISEFFAVIKMNYQDKLFLVECTSSFQGILDNLNLLGPTLHLFTIT